MLTSVQYNAKILPAIHSWHGFINCRQEVPMSLPRPSINVPNAASSGGHTECAWLSRSYGLPYQCQPFTKDNEPWLKT